MLLSEFRLLHQVVAVGGVLFALFVVQIWFAVDPNLDGF